MNIAYEQKLVDYMAKKGYAALSVEMVSPVGACADTSELSIGFVRARDLAAFREKAVRVFPCEQGDLLILSRGIETDDNIQLSLHSFFGAKDVRAEGMRAFTFK